ncbi:hypothetical protein CRG98_036001 [Punica granatum]|uniref:Uncharacterized protein n=1 Tax=Punica granatum TaxID=22663 RepID=A0A2I0II12_PUNGR|nr:hypothetical protein CRG98_036001 [Punica granatum]
MDPACAFYGLPTDEEFFQALVALNDPWLEFLVDLRKSSYRRSEEIHLRWSKIKLVMDTLVEIEEKARTLGHGIEATKGRLTRELR